MKTDTQLKKDGIQFLIKNMGGVDTERFVALLIKDRCDYTKWQKSLWRGKSVREISTEAMKAVDKNDD